MSNVNEMQVQEVNALSLIESTNLQSIQGSIQKINQFQDLVQSQFAQGHDFGVVPGTSKPTLLKPGAEKLIMLLGLTSEFEILDSTRDFDTGFFQYQVVCRLKKYGDVITEGFGSCNTKEKKYVHSDGFSQDNTVLKMAKKRALVDAALLVGSLSGVFTQDMDDEDLDGNSFENQEKVYTDRDGTITNAQSKRLYAISKGNGKLINQVISKYGYNRSEQINKTDYDAICQEVEASVTQG